MMPTTGGGIGGGDWEEHIGHFLIVLGGSVKLSSFGIAILIIWQRIREKR